MSDAELLALAALVNAYTAQTIAANDDRKSRDVAMAYDGHANPLSLKKLERELIRRGVLPDLTA